MSTITMLDIARDTHHRDGFPETSERFRSNQQILEQSGRLTSRFVPVVREGGTA